MPCAPSAAVMFEHEIRIPINGGDKSRVTDAADQLFAQDQRIFGSQNYAGQPDRPASARIGGKRLSLGHRCSSCRGRRGGTLTSMLAQLGHVAVQSTIDIRGIEIILTRNSDQRE